MIHDVLRKKKLVGKIIIKKNIWSGVRSEHPSTSFSSNYIYDQLITYNKEKLILLEEKEYLPAPML